MPFFAQKNVFCAFLLRIFRIRHLHVTYFYCHFSLFFQIRWKWIIHASEKRVYVKREAKNESEKTWDEIFSGNLPKYFGEIVCVPDRHLFLLIKQQE